VRQLTTADFESFISAKSAAAIHFDSAWDVRYRPILHDKMLEAEGVLGHQANFGEVDCDSNPELAKSIPVQNVPLVAYYRDGKLIAALVGAGQDVGARLRRILLGQAIGHKDGNDCCES
jgi:thioredoxin-like negative regulator of GroEL